MAAYKKAAEEAGIGVSTLRRWVSLVKGRPSDEWEEVLRPSRRDHPRRKPDFCSEAAWMFFKTDYLRVEKPSFAACYRRLTRRAEKEGWTVPSLKVLKTRLFKEVPREVILLLREGEKALAELYPAQQRDRTGLEALEAVNADFHTFDVFVKWEDGQVSRPYLVAWQDIRSSKILSWRVVSQPSKEAVRLSFVDMARSWGIPRTAFLDNGREFTSKWLSGRIKHRYRFKIREEEPAGLFYLLGVDIHWTHPYNGRAKPIERAFRDMCEDIAKHPLCAGAYTGNSTKNKPANYGSRAVDIKDFRALVDTEIAHHNAREGRRGAHVQGRSFDAVFEASYQQAQIRRLSAEQERLCLLAAESLLLSRRDGSLGLMGNRYWSEALAPLRGQRVVVRFDPERLHEEVHVYSLDGRYISAASCLLRAGFADAEAAREYAKARRHYLKGLKALAKAEKRLDTSIYKEEAKREEYKIEPNVIELVQPHFEADDKGKDGQVIDVNELLRRGLDSLEEERRRYA